MDPTTGLLLIAIAIGFLAIALVPLLLYGRVLSRDPKHYELIVYKARKTLESGNAALALDQVEAGLIRYRRVADRSDALAQCEVELLLCEADCLVMQKKFVEALSAVKVASGLFQLAPEDTRFTLIRCLENDIFTTVALQQYGQYVKNHAEPISIRDPVVTRLVQSSPIARIKDPTDLEILGDLAARLAKAGIRHPWIWLTQAEVLRRQGKPNQVIPLLEEAAQRNQLDPTSESHLGRIYFDLKDYASAARLFRRAIKQGEDHPDSLLVAGKAFLSLAESDTSVAEEAIAEAATALRRACDGLPQDPIRRKLLALALARQHQVVQAVVAIQAAIQLDPSSATYRMEASALLLSLGRQDMAVAELLNAARLAPKTHSIIAEVAEQLARCGEHHHVVTIGEQALSLSSNDTKTRLILANSCFALREWEKVITHLRKAGSLQVDSSLRLCDALVGAKRLAEARTELDNLGQIAPDQPEVIIRRASLFLKLQQWGEAATLFEKARSARILADAEVYTAYARLRNGEVDLAHSLINGAMQLGQETPLAQQVAAMVAFRRGDLPEAKQAWEKLASPQSSEPNGHLGLAICFELEGQDSLATAAYHRGLEAKPDHASTLIRLAVVAQRSGDHAGAARWFGAASRVRASESRLRIAQSIAEASSDQADKAIELLETVDNGDVNAAVARANALVVRWSRGAKFFESGDYAKAVRDWEMLLNARPDIEGTESNLAKAYVRQAAKEVINDGRIADISEVRRLVNRALELRPQYVWARYLQALLDICDNQVSTARQTLFSIDAIVPTELVRYHLSVASVFSSLETERLEPDSEPLVDASWAADRWRLDYLMATRAAKLGNWGLAFSHHRAAFLRIAEVGPEDQVGVLEAIADELLAASVRANQAAEGESALDRYGHLASGRVGRRAGLLSAIAGRHAKTIERLVGPQLTNAEAKAVLLATCTLAIDYAERQDWSNSHEFARTAFLVSGKRAELGRLYVGIGVHLSHQHLKAGKPAKAHQTIAPLMPVAFGDPLAVHWVAVQARQIATHAESEPALVFDAWGLVVAAWVSTTKSARFWSEWRANADRHGARSASNVDAARLSESLVNRIRNEIDSAQPQLRSIAGADLLDANLGLELRCADLLNDCADSLTDVNWPSGISAGPEMIRRVGMHPNARIAKDFGSGGRSECVSILSQYLDGALGLATYLLDTMAPERALKVLTSVKTDDKNKSIRARAHFEYALKLASGKSNWTEAMSHFELAHLDGQSLSTHAETIAETAVEASREILTRDTDALEKAHKPLDAGWKIVGPHPKIQANTAALFVRQGMLALNREDKIDAEMLFRKALLVHDDDGTRNILANVVHEKVISQVVKDSKQAAIQLAREEISIRERISEVSEQRARKLIASSLLSFAIEHAREYRDKEPDINLLIVVLENSRSYWVEGDATRFLAVCLTERGRNNGQRKDYSRGIDDLSAALQLEDTHERRQSLAAMYYLRASQIQYLNKYAALEDLKKAHQVDPSNAEIRRIYYDFKRQLSA